jgi:hypothetical protein
VDKNEFHVDNRSFDCLAFQIDFSWIRIDFGVSDRFQTEDPTTQPASKQQTTATTSGRHTAGQPRCSLRWIHQ